MKNTKKIKVDYKYGRGLRERIVLYILEKLAPLHYRFCSGRTAWDLDSDKLLSFPEGTLAFSLGKFYKYHGFEPVPKAERHDVFHVLLGYSIFVKDEICMQFFLLGNGKPSVFTIGTILISFLLFPLHSRDFIKAYQRGKDSYPIGRLDFRSLLNTNLTELQNKILKHDY